MECNDDDATQRTVGRQQTYKSLFSFLSLFGARIHLFVVLLRCATDQRTRTEQLYASECICFVHHHMIGDSVASFFSATTTIINNKRF